MLKPRHGFATVPVDWPGATVVAIASGPSLTADDVNAVRGRARVIVVNNCYQLAPWADVLYAADYKWWRWHKGAPGFAGLKYTASPEATMWPDVQCLRVSGRSGLSLDPQSIRTGSNSGYQAINLAVHFGASRILLLGYDMQFGPLGQEHWHGKHPDRSRPLVNIFLPLFSTLVEPLREVGVEVINCSRATRLTCFPRATLQQALIEEAA